jgi:hypothetical protein
MRLGPFELSFTRVEDHGFGSDRYAGITWCGMFVGIEADGYTHT